MEARKILVLTVSALAIALLIGCISYTRYFGPIIEKPIKPVVINTQGAPTIGNPLAKVHIVVFEDFRCPHCAAFSAKVFPKIKAEYIDTGKVGYTLIPVAFLPGSKPLANAALEVYASSPDRFFPYADEVFLKNPRTKKELLNIAVLVNGIDIERLESCIKTKCHYQDLDQNLQQIIKVMGNDYSTPSLYVNGVLTPTNFRSVSAKIKEFLEKIP